MTGDKSYSKDTSVWPHITTVRPYLHDTTCFARSPWPVNRQDFKREILSPLHIAYSYANMDVSRIKICLDKSIQATQNMNPKGVIRSEQIVSNVCTRISLKLAFVHNNSKQKLNSVRVRMIPLP
jgi:hypothetical protein